MIEARKVANKIESEREKAIAYHDTIVPALEEIRYHIDKLELIVDNQMSVSYTHLQSNPTTYRVNDC